MLFQMAGAGKTHTMVGADNDPGTMVRALNDMFFYMEKTKDQNKYHVTMSYMEVCVEFNNRKIMAS